MPDGLESCCLPAGSWFSALLNCLLSALSSVYPKGKAREAPEEIALGWKRSVLKVPGGSFTSCNAADDLLGLRCEASGCGAGSPHQTVHGLLLETAVLGHDDSASQIDGLAALQAAFRSPESARMEDRDHDYSYRRFGTFRAYVHFRAARPRIG